ncbi:MAG: phosphodiester glycosidase family protein [Candidatus Eremiobacteraeota bacterium]|nr:phosphodiester glycosidase family protein [Candidatus Eremiobacteraeota bacterium]
MGPGVEFERWRLKTSDGPLQVSIAHIDLRNPNVGLGVGTRYDRIVGPGEPLSTMADRRSAEIGINADYFDISGNGEPTNLVIAHGVIQHAPNGRAVLMVGAGNHVVMGPASLKLQLIAPSGDALDIDSVNDWSHGAQLMLFTQAFGMPSEADASAEIALTPADNGAYRVVRAVADDLTFLPLAPDDLGIAARGNAAVNLLHAFKEGDSATLSQALTPQVDGLREAVGGGPILLRDGAPYEDPDAPSPEERDVRYPLTGAGTSADGATLWLVTVDGRAPARSIGVTRPMFGALLAALGASDAMAFDSGGSTEMVVRRLGEDHVSIANVPSDGRERSIADGLFVINTATPGPPARLVMRSEAASVLAGSHLSVTASSVDVNDQPVAPGGPVTFSVAPSSVATVDARGRVHALASGHVTISARSGPTSGELPLDVVSRVGELRIQPVYRVYAPSSEYALTAVATREDGTAIAVDSDAVRWSARGDGGALDAAGTVRTATQPSRLEVTARAGGSQADATLLVGAHEVRLASTLLPGESAGHWHLIKAPADINAELDQSNAPDGVSALHLSYDFVSSRSTRAAFIENEIALAGEPLLFSVQVFGDGSGAWLRAGYRNADGIADSITLARRISWKGWQTVRAEVPPQARWPITFTRLYVVAPPNTQAAGDIWLRNLGVWYAGPVRNAQ